MTIRPFLWFDDNAEEAIRFYVSLFPNSELHGVSPMIVTATIAGQPVMALNGGPTHNSTRPFRFSSSARTKPKSTAIGTRFSIMGANRTVAVGSKTDSGSPGKSFRSS